MSKEEGWLVHEHGSFQVLDSRLWSIQGSIGKSPLPRTMTVYKLDDGRLMLHSVIALSEDKMKELEQFGEIAYIVVPNAFHRYDANRFRQRYPNAIFLCPEQARKKVEEVIVCDDTMERVLPGLGVKLHCPEGLRYPECILECELDTGQALIVNDIFFNMKHLPGFSGFMMKVMGSTGFFGLTKLIGKYGLAKDRKKLRASLEILKTLSELRLIVVSHGDVLTEDVQEKLAKAIDNIR